MPHVLQQHCKWRRKRITPNYSSLDKTRWLWMLESKLSRSEQSPSRDRLRNRLWQVQDETIEVTRN